MTGSLRYGRLPFAFRPAIGLIIVVALSWIAFRAAVIASAPSTGSWWLARVAPHSLRLVPNRAAVTPDERAARLTLLAESARAEPLDSRPLRMSAQIDAAAENHAAVLRKLVAARALNPRDEIVRLMLVSEHLRAGNPVAAIEDAEAAMRLNSRLAAQLGPALPAMASASPAAERALRRAIESNPSWGRNIVSSNKLSVDAPGLVFSLIQQSSKASDRDAMRLQQAEFLSRLVASGDYDTALLAFINFLPVDAAARQRRVYDGGFEGLPGPAPFNWRLNTGPVDSAEIMRGVGDGNGLRLEFYDDRPITFASQLLLLSPGRYSVKSVASSLNGTMNTGLRWRLICHKPAGQRRAETLATLDLPALTARQTSASVDFTVPDGQCRAQMLVLDTPRSDAPAERQATIHSISVDRY